MEKNTPLTEAIFYILLAVRKPNHGYGIIQEVVLKEGKLAYFLTVVGALDLIADSHRRIRSLQLHRLRRVDTDIYYVASYAQTVKLWCTACRCCEAERAVVAELY